MWSRCLSKPEYIYGILSPLSVYYGRANFYIYRMTYITCMWATCLSKQEYNMFFESRTHMRRMKTKAYNNNPPHTYRNKALWLLIGNFSNQVCLAFFKSWSSVIKRSKVSTTPIALPSLHAQRGSQVDPRLYSSKK